jgi:hypothetical protein
VGLTVPVAQLEEGTNPMLPLAQKQPITMGESRQRFWIDPDVEVALTAQINEHFPGLAEPSGILAAGHVHQQSLPLMDCYNQDNPDCMPGLPSSHQKGGGAA